jgi:hypothetical protein
MISFMPSKPHAVAKISCVIRVKSAKEVLGVFRESILLNKFVVFQRG